MEGRVVSHYRVLIRLGAGGMGVVYRAEDSRLKRTVALKFLSPELTRDQDARDRFVQEAQAASALDHPNICAVYDVDTADEQLFIAMAYYEGATLRERIARGPLPIVEALDVARQIARGLEHAHHAGIVHRDIKPANVIVTRDGLVKIVDFGIAKVLDRTAQTRTGQALGTVSYMAPEQVHGYGADARVDLWALGVVLYEMLTGRQPFIGDRDLVVLHNILHEPPTPVRTLRADVPANVEQIVVRAMNKDPGGRYQSAHEMGDALTACLPAVTSTTNATQVPAPAASAGQRVVTVALGVALLTAVVTAGWFMHRAANARRVEDLVSQISKLADADTYAPALAALEEVERLAPGDARLRDSAARISETRDIVTDPPGADVFIKPYDQSSQPWRLLGKTPLKNVRLAREYFRWKFEREGYVTMDVFGPFNRTFLPLTPSGQFPPDSLRIPAGPLSLQLTGYNYLAQVPAAAFLIDKFEVTNRQYKAFVDAGGYTKPAYWARSFTKDGKTLDWSQAMVELRDRTGRAGPATWDVGMYPAGQDDYPVTGVSWYEADAFARYAGRSLPTVYHWARAAGVGQAAYIAPLSNLNGKGPAMVGSFAGISPVGAADMAGNAKEWCSNAVAGSENRYVLGGSWRDAAYQFTYADARAPFDRSEDNGFRLVTYLDAPPPTVTNPIPVARRDFRAERPAPDDVFTAYRSLYAYDPRPLEPVVEGRDESGAQWVREKVSIRAAYGNDRVPVYIFLPRNVQPPYQAVLYAPGVASLTRGDSASSVGAPGTDLRTFDYLILSGRAVVYPIYSGTFERNTGQTTVWPSRTRAYEDWMIRIINDGRRVMEYMLTRADIQHDAIAYLGVSWGATIAPRILAQESRFKTAVLTDGGFTQSPDVPPALDNINYLSRVTLPTLMVNGNGDFIFPVESGQNPFFDLLGTPRDQKTHVLLVGGHFIIAQQRSQVVRTVLDWLDRWLGVVQSAGAQK